MQGLLPCLLSQSSCGLKFTSHGEEWLSTVLLLLQLLPTLEWFFRLFMNFEHYMCFYNKWNNYCSFPAVASSCFEPPCMKFDISSVPSIWGQIDYLLCQLDRSSHISFQFKCEVKLRSISREFSWVEKTPIEQCCSAVIGFCNAFGDAVDWWANCTDNGYKKWVVFLKLQGFMW